MYHVRVDSRSESKSGDEVKESTEMSSIIVQPFSTGNPAIEVIRGTLRLYRDVAKVPREGRDRDAVVSSGDGERSTGEEAAPLPLPSTSSAPFTAAGTSLEGKDNNTNMVAVIDLPSHQTITDFCNFVGSELMNITHLRFLRDPVKNRSMVIIQLVDSEITDAFYKRYRGKRYNLLEKKVCNLVYVANVIVDGGSRLPFSTSSSMSLLSQSPPVEDSLFPILTQVATELPSCPVCLERLDFKVSGIVTTVCNHSFHCSCLSLWGDSSCPVCRYCSDPFGSSTKCETCGTPNSLWMCLICGHVGCGRYNGEHAFSHFEATNHTYSMELDSQRVWDYAGDGYVHRLIQNKNDGKLIEFSSTGADGSAATTSSDGAVVPPVKDKDRWEAVALEYENLLTSQLESQRDFYMNQVSDMEMHFQEKLSLVECRLREVEQRNVIQDRLIHSLKANCNSEKCTGALRLQKEIDELKELNNSLLENMTAADREKISMRSDYEALKQESERTKEDLSAQVRDLMFYLDTQKKVDECDLREEILSGSVCFTESPTATKTPLEMAKERRERKQRKKK
jgi:BRCA1-associated protein